MSTPAGFDWLLTLQSRPLATRRRLQTDCRSSPAIALRRIRPATRRQLGTVASDARNPHLGALARRAAARAKSGVPRLQTRSQRPTLLTDHRPWPSRTNSSECGCRRGNTDGACWTSLQRTRVLRITTWRRSLRRCADGHIPDLMRTASTTPPRHTLRAERPSPDVCSPAEPAGISLRHASSATHTASLEGPPAGIRANR